MVKIIVSDIDGCLSPEDSSAWDGPLFSSLMSLARKATARRTTLAPITLCTGRPQPYVEPLSKLLDIRMPIICENGAVVYSLDDNWSRFGPGVTREKLEGLRAVRRFIEREVLPGHPEALYQFGKEAMLSVYSAKPKILPHIQQAVEGHIRDRDLPPVVMGLTHFYLNISMAGVDGAPSRLSDLV
jgi:hydroxymethylpyrimidine pyrophosphatase-like HAD family hydrolase